MTVPRIDSRCQAVIRPLAALLGISLAANAGDTWKTSAQPQQDGVRVNQITSQSLVEPKIVPMVKPGQRPRRRPIRRVGDLPPVIEVHGMALDKADPQLQGQGQKDEETSGHRLAIDANAGAGPTRSQGLHLLRVGASGSLANARKKGWTAKERRRQERRGLSGSEVIEEGNLHTKIAVLAADASRVKHHSFAPVAAPVDRPDSSAPIAGQDIKGDGDDNDDNDASETAPVEPPTPAPTAMPTWAPTPWPTLSPPSSDAAQGPSPVAAQHASSSAGEGAFPEPLPAEGQQKRDADPISLLRCAVLVVCGLLVAALGVAAYKAQDSQRGAVQRGRRSSRLPPGQRSVGRSSSASSSGGNTSSSSSTASSAVVCEVERVRQRHQKLLARRRQGGADAAQSTKEYRTLIHTMQCPKIEKLLDTKLPEVDNYRCAVGPAGLAQAQAALHMEAHGPNRITPPVGSSKLLKLLKMTFLGLFNILLWTCVVAEVIFTQMRRNKKMHTSAHMHSAVADYATPAILVFVIVSAAVLQWYTELQAESMMEGLQRMQAQESVRTLRISIDGERLELELEPWELVPGDVVLLAQGQRVPADVRIVHCTGGLEVDNAALTGETQPEVRLARAEDSDVSPLEARNLAFSGTTVLKGNATCVVHATADDTFLGKIASGIKDSHTMSTLEIQIEHFVHMIAGVAVCIGVAMFLANVLFRKHDSIAKVLESAATALFAQVPEGLLPTVTILLMITSKHMSVHKVLVRKLDAVETLGCVNVICSDKTGTLTAGQMSVTCCAIREQTNASHPNESQAQDPWSSLMTSAPWEALRIVSDVHTFSETETSQQGELSALFFCGLLNNGAALMPLSDLPGECRESSGEGLWTDHWRVLGSPTEAAILNAAIETLGGPDRAVQLRAVHSTVFEIPFNSENKWMLTVHAKSEPIAWKGPYMVLLKGAPERVLDFCTELHQEARQSVEESQRELMVKGLRVVCFASRPLSAAEVRGGNFEGTNAGDTSFPMEGFRFVGLVGIEDPPKAGVAEAVLAAQRAGVKVVMVTGDHPETAKAIATRINILPQAPLESDAKEFGVIKGAALDERLPQGECFSTDDPAELHEWWQKVVEHTRVFARTSPIHKYVIVQAYQFFGHGGVGDVVAMTGDGVNDAPALKQAQVGVAMGIRGTEVAKDAADIILMDDNFAAIVKGMEQGRLATDNLQKSIMYTLCSKLPQVMPSFVELAGVPLALNVAQVLLIDIGTDIWTAITYALQPAEVMLMNRPPRHPRLERIVNGQVLVYSYGYMGMMQTIFCWIMFFLTPGVVGLVNKPERDYTDEEVEVSKRGMTGYYWTLLLGQLAAAISTTTKSQPILGRHGYGFPNHLLTLFLVGEVLFGLLVIYWRPMQEAFSTASLPMTQLCLPLLAFVMISACDEIRKAATFAQIADSDGDARLVANSAQAPEPTPEDLFLLG